MSQAARTAARYELQRWLVTQGLRGTPATDLIEGFSTRLPSIGLEIIRCHVTVRSIHPEFGAVAHLWTRDAGTEHTAFARQVSPAWRQSPLYHLLASDQDEFRARLQTDPGLDRFPILGELKAGGATDYFATRFLFGNPDNLEEIDPEAPPEGMLLSLVTDVPQGFSDGDLDDLRQLLPALALALKTGANRQMAADLLATYIGPDAGERVLSGDIQRGSSETIGAVILYFDLSGFTQLSEALPGGQIIDMLNDYYGSVVAEIDAGGGNVLKFMGDGLLAIFTGRDRTATGLAAIETITAIRDTVRAVNTRRQTDGLPATTCTMALHAGDVLYGNIGGQNRLDFTVIGPAVNTTARISGMCGPVGQQIVISDRVARPLVAHRKDLVSLGQYRMRGVADRHELFTLD